MNTNNTAPQGASVTIDVTPDRHGNQVLSYSYDYNDGEMYFCFHLLSEVGQPWQEEARQALALLCTERDSRVVTVELPEYPWYVDALVTDANPAANFPCDPLDAAYVVKGFWRYVTAEMGGAHPYAVSSGEINMMQEIVDATNHVQYAWEEDTGECTGVWVYDVCEPYGYWLAENTTESGLPAGHRCAAYLCYLISQSRK